MQLAEAKSRVGVELVSQPDAIAVVSLADPTRVAHTQLQPAASHHQQIQPLEI